MTTDWSTSHQWDCPFCGRAVTLNHTDKRSDLVELFRESAVGDTVVQVNANRCPNASCRQVSVWVYWHSVLNRLSSGRVDRIKSLKKLRLVPASSAKVLPNYIPEHLRRDYEEACAIVELSPKASATISRRCLQGMIRDFWKIQEKRLIDEIDALAGKVAPEDWEAIDAVRQVGNIGAHMGKEVDVIVDVHPNEAALLIGLIEQLFEDWYVSRHQRNERLAAVKGLALRKAPGKVRSAKEPGPDEDILNTVAPDD